MLGKERSKRLRDARTTPSEQSSGSRSSAKESPEAGSSSGKRRRCVDVVSKRLHNEETKFAKSVIGRDGIPEFDQFLDCLIREKRLEILKRNGINPANMSSILHRARANAAKAFKEL